MFLRRVIEEKMDMALAQAEGREVLSPSGYSRREKGKGKAAELEVPLDPNLIPRRVRASRWCPACAPACAMQIPVYPKVGASVVHVPRPGLLNAGRHRPQQPPPPSPERGRGGGPSGQSHSGCRAVAGDVKAVGGGGFWRLGMRFGLVLGYGNAFGVEAVQCGRGRGVLPLPPFK